MAASLINTECKRYGCMKNLLACFANCRYNTRCDDLRNEIESKTDQAVKDINQYLSERGQSPISIQFLKRGLKFTAAAAQAKEKLKPRQLKAPLKLTESASKTEKRRKTGSRRMEKKSKKPAAKSQETQEQPSRVTSGAGEAAVEKRTARSRSKPRRPRAASANGNSSRKGSKTYIILEGRSATIVDERGLLQHILSGASSDVRYFEAMEVEARLQIVAMR